MMNYDPVAIFVESIIKSLVIHRGHGPAISRRKLVCQNILTSIFPRLADDNSVDITVSEMSSHGRSQLEAHHAAAVNFQAIDDVKYLQLFRVLGSYHSWLSYLSACQFHYESAEYFLHSKKHPAGTGCIYTLLFLCDTYIRNVNVHWVFCGFQQVRHSLLYYTSMGFNQRSQNADKEYSCYDKKGYSYGYFYSNAFLG